MNAESVAENKSEIDKTAGEIAKDKISIESQISTFNDSYTEDMAALSQAIEEGLAAIGESDSAGARGAALTAIQNALSAALSSIGESDTTGARGNAISSISIALQNALAAIGEDNSSGARGAALTSIQNLYDSLVGSSFRLCRRRSSRSE